MLIKRKVAPSSGVCFAWRPLQVAEGTVWLEFVEWTKVWGEYVYKRIDHTWEPGAGGY